VGWSRGRPQYALADAIQLTDVMVSRSSEAENKPFDSCAAYP